MKMETKKEVFDRYKDEYYKARGKMGKRKKLTQILDKVCDVTNMLRKSVIRRFNHLQTVDPCKEEKRGRLLYYTPDVTCALKEIWEAGGEVCGELLQPVISEYVSIFKRDGAWKHSDETTGKILAISEGTTKERISHFMKIKRKSRGFSTTQASQIKHIIPIFHGDWKEKPVGAGQLDTVAHCGHTVVGDYIFTLNYIDISVLWDNMRAQWNKGQLATQESLAFIKKSLPWNLLEVHPDTGSEFINWHMKGWCDTNNIVMTRSRPNHKNDNMHVEERNGHIVRKWIGYMRFDCKEAVATLNDVYAVLNPYLNHFIASRRLIEKSEVNGKWKKKYEKVAKTPYQRVMEHPKISKEVKKRLRQEHGKLNPAIMKKEIDRLKAILYDVQRKHGKTQK
jgi:hypothetical protein